MGAGFDQRRRVHLLLGDLFFEAKRRRDDRNPVRLYVTPLVVDSSGNITSYPASYLCRQPGSDGNHTPAWVNFTIPIS